MKWKLLLALVALIAVAAGAFTWYSMTSAPGSALTDLQVGSEAPAFTLNDWTGKAHSLADFRGKFVVLEWFNEDCPFVKKHYTSGNMQKLQEEYTGKDVVWLSINSSARFKQGHMTSESAAKTISEWRIKATSILFDHDGKVGRMYGAKTTPHMFVIDKEGKLFYRGAIDSKATTNAADVAAAENYVKVALDNSMAGKPIANPSTKPYGCSVKY
jgi:peroxiredoxin